MIWCGDEFGAMSCGAGNLSRCAGGANSYNFQSCGVMNLSAGDYLRFCSAMSCAVLTLW